MYELTLPYRPPFDWTRLVRFFEVRAIPGVETVTGESYERAVRLGDRRGTISVRPSPTESSLVVGVSLPVSTRVEVTRRLTAMFDLDADITAIAGDLARSPVVGPLARRHPGIRVPGCWEPFEIVVRAIVGQQVSVAAARTILGRIVARTSDGGPVSFPTAARLADLDVCGLGMPDRRAESVRKVAEAVAKGTIVLSKADEARQGLLAMSGIGPWTVEYVAMRALRDRDAFPHGDLVLRRVAGKGTAVSARELHAMAEEWRPWRAYAAILLWSASS